jgi:diacylglycerol kinase (ATP)
VEAGDRNVVTGLPPMRRIRRFAAVLGTLAIVGFAALLWKVVAKRGEPIGPDEPLGRLFAAGRTGILTGACRTLHWAGHPFVLLALGAAAALAAWRRRCRPVALLVLAVTVGAMALAEGIKPLLNRARPDPALWLVSTQGGSFPSGHATSVTAMALLGIGLAWTRGPSSAARWVWLAGGVLLCVGTGLSRVYLGVHHPSDVAAGGTLGTAWLCLCWLRFMRDDSASS